MRYKTQNALTKTCRRIFSGLCIYREVAFPDLTSDKGFLLRYDIAIPEVEILVEYHGCAKFVKFVHKRLSSFKRARKHDALKKAYAKHMGWVFVEFTARDNVRNESLVLKRIEDAC